MKINSIYLGSIPISRLMLNGKIIWESAIPFYVTGFSIIETYTKGKCNVCVALLCLGDAESVTYGNASALICDAVLVNGESVTESDGLALARVMLAILSRGISESQTDSKANSIVADVVLSKSVIHHFTLTKGKGYSCDAVLVDGETSIKFRRDGQGRVGFVELCEGKTKLNVYTDSKATSAIRQYMHNNKLCFLSHIEGVINVNDLLLSEGKTLIKSSALSLENSMSANFVIGKTETETYGEGDLSKIPSPTFKGDAYNGLLGLGNHIISNVGLGNGEGTSQINASATTSLYYIPYQVEDTLYIKSVYNATVTDGVLSIT